MQTFETRTSPLLQCTVCCRMFVAGPGLPGSGHEVVACPHCGSHYCHPIAESLRVRPNGEPCFCTGRAD